MIYETGNEVRVSALLVKDENNTADLLSHRDGLILFVIIMLVILSDILAFFNLLNELTIYDFFWID